MLGFTADNVQLKIANISKYIVTMRHMHLFSSMDFIPNRGLVEGYIERPGRCMTTPVSWQSDFLGESWEQIWPCTLERVLVRRSDCHEG